MEGRNEHIFSRHISKRRMLCNAAIFLGYFHCAHISNRRVSRRIVVGEEAHFSYLIVLASLSLAEMGVICEKNSSKKKRVIVFLLCVFYSKKNH